MTESKRNIRFARRAAVGLLALCFATGPAAAEWKPLFNGHDLAGWDTSRGRPSIRNGKWTIEDGALVGGWDKAHPGPGWLLSGRDYADFRLKLQFWISRGGNSGVAVRDPSHGAQNPARAGYEIQIKSDDKDAKNPTGSIYDAASAPGGKLRELEWNDLEIRCQGPLIAVWLNGEKVAEAKDERSLRGAIGFQIHGQKEHADLVKFRNIMIDEAK
jgi:hypothetical protein